MYMNIYSINIRHIHEEAMRHQAIILDVRPRNEFYKAHIPMAMNIPFDELEENDIALSRCRVIIIYCRTGATSMKAARILTNKGYKVINCVGGIVNYRGQLTKNRPFY